MTQNPMRIKLRCESCRAPAFLNSEHYRTLVKGSELALFCPHCAHQFVFHPTRNRGVKVARLDRMSPEEAVPDSAPVPLSPPAPAQVSAPVFPPPPFALLSVGAASPVSATAPAPPFAPMGGGPSATAPVVSPPQGNEVVTRSDAKRLTLKERWKRLPPWQQWLAVGLAIVVLAVLMFSTPGGGSGRGAPEAAAPEAADSRPSKPGPKRPADTKQAPEARQP
jgi:hypothetical protein